MVVLERLKALCHRHDDVRSHASHQDHSVETTSLLRNSDVQENSGPSNPNGDEQTSMEGPLSTTQLILLSLSIFGLQLAWAAELSNGSPFLLSLGMSKSLLAIVWIAGPLAGVLVQPIIGIWSDSCQISWGRRRPFLIAGAVFSAVSLLCLSWTVDIVEGVARLFGADPKSDAAGLAAQIFAVVWIYVLDFAVNVLQAAVRAFIVDMAPPFQQDVANAWASRLSGIANIFGYLLGYANLPALLPWLGDTQLKILCAIGSASLIITVTISSVAIKEKNPRIEWPSSRSTIKSILAFLKTSFTAFSRLPDQTRRVCFAQFFNWIGWFPFLFYISTYIGQLYVNPFLEQNPNATKAEIDEAWNAGTRLGSFALLTFAITSFTGNALLPLIIQPLASTESGIAKTDGILSRLRVPNLTIRRAWMLSHVFFAICMWSTLFIKTPIAGAVMSGFVGVSWSLTNWAPYAIIAADISLRDREKRRRGVVTREDQSPEDPSLGDFPGKDHNESMDQAGVVLGLHNVAVSAPQILASLIASVIFHLTQKSRQTANDDSIAQVLRFGGLAALIAWWATSRVH